MDQSALTEALDGHQFVATQSFCMVLAFAPRDADFRGHSAFVVVGAMPRLGLKIGPICARSGRRSRCGFQPFGDLAANGEFRRGSQRGKTTLSGLLARAVLHPS